MDVRYLSRHRRAFAQAPKVPQRGGKESSRDGRRREVPPQKQERGTEEAGRLGRLGQGADPERREEEAGRLGRRGQGADPERREEEARRLGRRAQEETQGELTIGAPPPQRRKYFSGVIVMRSA